MKTREFRRMHQGPLEVTVYCPVSGSASIIYEANRRVDAFYEFSFDYGPVLRKAFASLADTHERRSQDDLSVIGPMHPSGKPYNTDWDVDPSDIHPSDLDPEADIRVMMRCEVDCGSCSVGGPPQNEPCWDYVGIGCNVKVQTYALDILALATRGRMTPLRLWHLVMRQTNENGHRSDQLEGVDYGEITGLWEQHPDEFPGFETGEPLYALEKIEDPKVVKECLIFDGLFWVWMAPDRFPVSPAAHDEPMNALPEKHPSENLSAIEALPDEVLISIISSLPLLSLVNFASTSWSLRTRVFKNDYLACAWLFDSAPWWISVPTQTPCESEPSVTVKPYLASRWPEQTLTTLSFPAGLDWAYVKRCQGSGSMHNRRRIWNVALDIERVADLAGV